MTVTSTIVAEFVGVVEFSRPPNNFFDLEVVQGILGAYEALAATDCRAIVLCSDGRHFCAGANFRKAPPASGDVPAQPQPHLYDVAANLFEQPLPVVAAVQGAAVGGGLGLALSADFRVTTADSRWVANFSHVGFHQGFGLSATLPPLVGQQKALHMLYNSRALTGREACEAGLSDRLAEPADLRSAAIDMAGELARSAPLALRAIRATMRTDLVARIRTTMAAERAAQEILRETEDFRLGVGARPGDPPRFSNR